MTDAILQTKLQVPLLRSSLVLRPRLTDKRNTGMDGRLILVSAPAGSGKTTLVTEWLNQSHQKGAWLSLDDSDNDPRRFLDYMLAALRQVQAEVGRPIEAMLQSPQPPPPELILTALVNELASNPQSFILVLDDYHVIHKKIAGYIADLIPDGATMQLGIGAIPDAVLKYLHHKKDLGVHSELFSDGVIDLVNEGVLTNARKTLHPGKIIAGFMLGTRTLYQWADDNPLIEFHRTEYVNDPFVIAQNERMVAINSAIEVDLTGQVCADSIGPKLYSGVGGQLDFIYGASRSKGGVPIIALPSTTTLRDGTLITRIAAMLKVGATELVLGVLASVIVMWFSRQREFRADAGGAQLAGRQKMIDALRALQLAHDPQGLPSEQFAAFGISGGMGRFGKLFMTHPPLEERIEALERAR